MATTITGISKPKVLSNLDTYNHTALTTGPYAVTVRLSEVPASGITITIKQNASTIIATSAPAAGQNHVEVRSVLNCTATDVIGVIIASSTAIDTVPNNIKAILTISQGTIG